MTSWNFNTVDLCNLGCVTSYRFNSSADFPGPWAHRSPLVLLFSPCIKNPSGASSTKFKRPALQSPICVVMGIMTITPARCTLLLAYGDSDYSDGLNCSKEGRTTHLDSHRCLVSSSIEISRKLSNTELPAIVHKALDDSKLLAVTVAAADEAVALLLTHYSCSSLWFETTRVCSDAPGTALGGTSSLKWLRPLVLPFNSRKSSRSTSSFDCNWQTNQWTGFPWMSLRRRQTPPDLPVLTAAPLHPRTRTESPYPEATLITLVTWSMALPLTRHRREVSDIFASWFRHDGSVFLSCLVAATPCAGLIMPAIEVQGSNLFISVLWVSCRHCTLSHSAPFPPNFLWIYQQLRFTAKHAVDVHLEAVDKSRYSTIRQAILVGPASAVFVKSSLFDSWAQSYQHVTTSARPHFGVVMSPCPHRVPVWPLPLCWRWSNASQQ